jgi:hypothetical protein
MVTSPSSATHPYGHHFVQTPKKFPTRFLNHTLREYPCLCENVGLVLVILLFNPFTLYSNFPFAYGFGAAVPLSDCFLMESHTHYSAKALVF